MKIELIDLLNLDVKFNSLRWVVKLKRFQGYRNNGTRGIEKY